MRILINELKENIIKLLSKNIQIEDAISVANYLIYAEMSGNKTQGIIKLAGTNPIQNIIADYPIKVVKETPVSALLDGGKNPAIVVANKAMNLAIKKAKKIGIAVVGANNTYSSNGAQAYYVEQIAKQDLIGIMMSRSPGSMAPFNSIDPLFGTNPIGFAFPTNDEPIVFDAATSAMTFYGLIVAKAHNQKLEEGVATDIEGNPTTNPEDVINGGAINPFGNSYKAAGLSMLVELLAGPLINGAYLDYKTFEEEWGTTIIAINPNILTDVNKFKEECSNFVKIVKSSRTRENETIHFPNDKSRNNYNQALINGYVDIDEIIYKEIFSKM